MEAAQPSRTALRVALRRAAHQLYDAPPLILEDPFAVSILGPAYRADLEKTITKLDKPFSVALRAFLVVRSRYAEDQLAAAIARGVTQYVLLGAGLDTFAHRNPYPSLRVFEVDHPATQEWKRELLATNKLPHPPSLTYAPVDFETQSLPNQLQIAGHDPTKPTVFAWLGVVPYLTPEAFRATIAFIAEQPQGTGLIFDYGQPRSVLPLHEQLALDSLASRTQLVGEPLQLFFTPREIARELSAFYDLEDLGSSELNERYLSGRTDKLRLLGAAGRIVSAWL